MRGGGGVGVLPLWKKEHNGNSCGFFVFFFFSFFCQVMKNYFSGKETRNLKSFIFFFSPFLEVTFKYTENILLSFLFKNATLTLQYLKSLKELTRKKYFHLPETELLPAFMGVPDSKPH